MSKNPPSDSGPNVKPSKATESLGDLVNSVLLIVLDSATGECKCEACKTARKMAPKLKALLMMQRVKEIKKVE